MIKYLGEKDNLPGEIWKDVVGYEGYYKVSNLGRIISCRKTQRGHTKLLKTGETPAGYEHCGLSKDGITKQYYIHVLVAMAFVPGWFEGSEVDHIDKIRNHNDYSNLRWVTHIDNLHYSLDNMRNKQTCKLFKPIKQIDTQTSEVINSYKSIQEASNSTGINRENISGAAHHRYGQITAGGYIWEFICE